MRPKENFTPFAAAGLGLTLAILASFQIYIAREPGRIAGDETRSRATAVSAGGTLFARNCAPCHGSDGEGDVGPALNDQQFLNNTGDDTIFSIISSGVPGSEMPAWNQSHGGPLTDEDVRQLTAFVRAWQPAAPDRRATPPVGDPAHGAQIFASICYACHGPQGQGTDRAPALNDPVLLNQFDDAWFRDTILQGRPAQGMPTWGTVLSPQQVTDLVALFDEWRKGNHPLPATTATPAATTAASPTATPGSTAEIARPSNPGGPGPAVDLTGDPKAGAQIFVDNCQKCHGDQGAGGVANPGSTEGTIPELNPLDETLIDKDPKVYAYNLDLFLEHGSSMEGPSPKEKMPAWGDEKKLTPQQIADVIAYVMSLNPAK